MKKQELNNFEGRMPFAFPSSADLRGRQSVRATFKLTEQAINALSIVSTHLGIKQKSLFDHLIEDAKILGAIAGNIKSEMFHELDRVQKTYVVSRKTLSSLREVADKFDAPRDALVESAIKRLLPIIKEEKKLHRKRKEILEDLSGYIVQGENLFEKSNKLLGEDDPICERLQSLITGNRNAERDVRSFIQRGEKIEEF